MSHTSGTTAADPQAPAHSEQTPAAPAGASAAEQEPGFGSRGRARRRARFLRKARELAYRDLGGLVFSLHRFSQRNDALVSAKLSTLTQIDSELRAIEAGLHERQPLTVLREAGVTACPRCSAIHSSEDNFCPNCAMPSTRHADLPAGFQASPATPAPAAAPPAPPVPGGEEPTAPAATEPAAPAAPAVPPPAPPAALGEDGPTEIIRPPASNA